MEHCIGVMLLEQLYEVYGKENVTHTTKGIRVKDDVRNKVCMVDIRVGEVAGNE